MRKTARQLLRLHCPLDIDANDTARRIEHAIYYHCIAEKKGFFIYRHHLVSNGLRLRDDPAYQQMVREGNAEAAVDSVLDLRKRIVSGEMKALKEQRESEEAAARTAALRARDEARISKSNEETASEQSDDEAEGEWLKCSRCGSSDVDYALLQIRSADEGMTAYVTCRSCGQREKLE